MKHYQVTFQLRSANRSAVIDIFPTREDAIEYCVYARELVRDLWVPGEYRFVFHESGTAIDLYNDKDEVELSYSFTIKEVEL